MASASIGVAEQNIARLQGALDDAQWVLQHAEQAQDVAQRAHRWSGRHRVLLRTTIFIGVGAIVVAVVIALLRRSSRSVGDAGLEPPERSARAAC
jgi:hypothetical protein